MKDMKPTEFLSSSGPHREKHHPDIASDISSDIPSGSIAF